MLNGVLIVGYRTVFISICGIWFFVGLVVFAVVCLFHTLVVSLLKSLIGRSIEADLWISQESLLCGRGWPCWVQMVVVLLRRSVTSTCSRSTVRQRHLNNGMQMIISGAQLWPYVGHPSIYRFGFMRIEKQQVVFM